MVGFAPIQAPGISFGDATAKPDQRAITRELAAEAIRILRDNKAFVQERVVVPGEGPRYVYQIVEELIDLTYTNPDPKTDKRRLEVVKQLDLVIGDKREWALDALAKLGHLHQLAGLLARDVVLPGHTAAMKQVEDAILHDPANKRLRPMGEALAALSRPRMELALTAHPTDTGSIESMQAQRALAQSLTAWRNGQGDKQAVEAALATYMKTPLLRKKDGHYKAYGAADETRWMLNYLGNIYDDLDGIYQPYDQTLKANYNNEYKPQDFKLGIGLHSWGSSGDKDGNKKITADTTLHAATLHTREILQRYLHDLDAAQLPGMHGWRTVISDVAASVAAIEGQIRQSLEDGGGHLSEGDFDRHLGALREAMNKLDQQARTQQGATFTGTAAQGFANALRSQAGAFPAAVPLLRKAELFGFSFGKIEYRETAEEYERVAGELVPEYKLLMKPIWDDKAKLGKLNKELADAYSKKQSEKDPAIAAGIEKTVVTLSADIEKLETQIKKETARIEPARLGILREKLKDPEAFRAGLAELKTRLKGQAGKPYSDSDTLPITYQTLKRMELARDLPEMFRNNVLAECQNTSNFLEALLLQHAVGEGDRRARLNIIPLFEEHAVLERAPEIVGAALNDEYYAEHLGEMGGATGMTQQVQLAHSDNARRAGMPAARGYIYDAHDRLREVVKNHEKATGQKIALQFFEGGGQSDPYRGGIRAISASVREFRTPEFTKLTFQGIDLYNFLNVPQALQRLFVRNLASSAASLHLNPGQQASHPAMNDKVVAALKMTKDDYVTLFDSPQFSEFMDVLGYKHESAAGQGGTRSAARGGNDGVISVKAMRTIGFSETLQHCGIAPTWIGIKTLRRNMEQQFGRKLDPEFLNRCYKQSPIFKDVVDRALYGLIRSDMELLDRKSNHHPLMAERFTPEYAEAYKLCLEAFTGRAANKFQQRDTRKAPPANDPVNMRRVLIEQLFPHAGDTLGEQWRYLKAVRSLRSHWQTIQGGQDTGAQEIYDMLLKNMARTVHNGRVTLIDDPEHAIAHAHELFGAGFKQKMQFHLNNMSEHSRNRAG